MKFDVKNIPWKKVLTTAVPVGIAVIGAAVGAIGEQKKAAEFDQMKQDIAALKGGKS